VIQLGDKPARRHPGEGHVDLTYGSLTNLCPEELETE
jgi:hypothetical protein